MKILDGKEISKKITKQLKQEIKELGYEPKLFIFQVGDNPASNKYIEFKIKKAKELGIDAINIKYDLNISQQILINNIKELTNNCHGAIVQLPLPESLNTNEVLNAIPFNKDIDGLAKGNKDIIPATPRGILTLMEEYDVNIKGKVIGVIGQSNLVGKPIADLIEKMHPAKVMRFDIDTGIKGSEEADILIVAAGSKNLVRKENIKKGVVIIDVGINTLSNGKISGDVDRTSVGEIPSAMSPVPGGVGPMTVISLFQNLIDTLK